MDLRDVKRMECRIEVEREEVKSEKRKLGNSA